MKDGESLAAYIERRIREAFSDLADDLASVQMDEDTAAAVPFELFAKEQELVSAWRDIVAGKGE